MEEGFELNDRKTYRPIAQIGLMCNRLLISCSHPDDCSALLRIAVCGSGFIDNRQFAKKLNINGTKVLIE